MNVLIKGVGKKVKVKKRHKTRSKDDDLKGYDEKPFAPKASALEWCTCRHPILPENISQYFDAYRLRRIKENDNCLSLKKPGRNIDLITSMILLRRANIGARGKAATKMVMNPNWECKKKLSTQQNSLFCQNDWPQNRKMKKSPIT